MNPSTGYNSPVQQSSTPPIHGQQSTTPLIMPNIMPNIQMTQGYDIELSQTYSNQSNLVKHPISEISANLTC